MTIRWVARVYDKDGRLVSTRVFPTYADAKAFAEDVMKRRGHARVVLENVSMLTEGRS